MEYDWDPFKNQRNIKKHGLDFEDAEIVFTGNVIHFQDERFPYGEDRFITLGEIEGRVVIIVHTQRENLTRIISMRKANEREKKIYFQQLKKSR
jgi:uncharacterized DUF497 family protein